MNKITYHKHCRQHKAVKQVKRELIKLLKDFAYIESSCNICLTGVADEDLFELKYIISKHYKNINTRLTEELKIIPTEAEFSNDIYWGTINFIMGIDDIIGIIHEGYPFNIMEYTFTFSNADAPVEAKKQQYASHFKASPLIGFRKSFFAYRGENKRQIWPLTVSPEDLKGVDKIVIQYQ